MYASHFGLAERPFSLAPDPRFLYLSDVHREALAHLLYGIGGGGSFVLLTGEVGTGKTTMCRTLLEQLPPDVDAAMIFNPRLSAVELLATVCDELRIQYPAGTTSLKALVDALSRALLEAHGRGRRTVLIIDEAQNLGAEVLEEIRLLTNLETTRDKLLQVILIGQPELADLLARPELRQLAQRITARCHLRPFTEAETRAYLHHRLEVAGQREPIFGPRAMRRAHRLSRGVPRLLNTICDRALLGAYASGRTRVTAAIVRQAAREVLGRPARRRRWALAAVAVAALAALGAGITWLGPASVPDIRSWALRGNTGGASQAAPTAPPAPAVAATAAEPAPPGPGLADVLGGVAAKTSRTAAFSRLYAAWHVEVSPRASDLGCEYGYVAGLRCIRRTGTWAQLRRFDLPAVLPLVAPSGETRYAALTGLDETRATLEIGEHHMAVPIAEIERFWRGPFVLIWKPPVGTVPLVPGMRSGDVLWLRRRLAEPAASTAAATGSRVYDEELRRKVVAFQQAESLAPDGIVGEETLVRLLAKAPGSDVPSLSGARP